ncbi:glycoside hydrolase family 32 protein [Weissella hellenica]|nr:glycoside hydrolase family 32 protein [Weissella hellenica]
MTEKLIQVTNPRYRPNFHVTAPSGWINDPNGFVYFKGYYHIFYQYHPYSAEWGPMHWGHARSLDLVHWESLPIALSPEKPISKNGIFSGSALVKDDKLYLMYTGHHFGDSGDDDDFYEDQNIAVSEDGLNFEKYANNPVISTPPRDNTANFRDPKLWQSDDTYYVILGGQTLDSKVGRVLLYSSKDLLSWHYEGAIAQSQSVATEGYMWECPDIFSLADQDVLLMSPQGMKPDHEKYLNLHQTGYMIGKLDVATANFERSGFVEIDHGHDFYASQTMLAPDGRRIMFGWMAMWESEMPEKKDGWAGALTFPRELTLKDNHVYMQPVAELDQLRIKQTKNKISFVSGSTTQLLLSDADSHEIQMQLKADEDFTITFMAADDAVLALQFAHQENKVTISRSDRIDKRIAYVNESAIIKLQLLIDRSSAEIFINDGETVFTERYYSEIHPNIILDRINFDDVQVTTYELEKDAVKY